MSEDVVHMVYTNQSLMTVVRFSVADIFFQVSDMFYVPISLTIDLCFFIRYFVFPIYVYWQ